MSPWPDLVVPAVAVALLVRVDARFVGPYFALSELVAGSEGLAALAFYRRKTLRAAIIRRFLYPLLLGFLLPLALEMPLTDVAWCGALAAGLLLWPVLFHGLPIGVSRRDWEVPALYLSFVGAYASLAATGALLFELAEYAARGDLRRWAAEQFIGWLATAIIGLFLVSVYRGAFGRLRSKSEGRMDDAFDEEEDYDEPPPAAPSRQSNA